MDTYLILAERDSVCMGDDATAPNAYSFNVSVDATLNDVFEHLAKKSYLASVAGKNHSWEAIANETSVAIIKGNNQFPQASPTLSHKVSQYTKGAVLRIYFVYNSAPD